MGGSLKYSCIMLVLLCSSVSYAFGEGGVKDFPYEDQGVRLSGHLALPDRRFSGPRPAILIFHDWMGAGDFSSDRARRLAEAGYIALAADMYGAGVRPKDQKEAASFAGRYKEDRPLMRQRALAALTALQKVEGVDGARVAALGFCFGGTVALELARAGAPLDGVVSFHGGLGTPDISLAKNIRGSVLALHGADDPFVPDSEVRAFEREMRDAGIDWQLIEYGDAVHAFTNPAAGKDKSKGTAYNERADRRSYRAMESFFQEIFQERDRPAEPRTTPVSHTTP